MGVICVSVNPTVGNIVGHIDNFPSAAKPRLRADANYTRETSSKTSTFFTKLVITFEVLNQLNWGARI